ncbi:MAG: DNA mismatch repair protein MutS [Myxococcota bacterium]
MSKAKSALDTPMMRQFLAIKARYPQEILFYRMGDFYEMFLKDAEIAAPLLDIALTTRDKNKEDAVPMCGIPVHAAEQHLAKLASKGYRVAICEQVEDARSVGGKRLVKRDVVEVVTPGLSSDPQSIEASRELCLAAVVPGNPAGLAVLDASTGDLRATEVAADSGETLPAALCEELVRLGPREVLVPADRPEVEPALARELPDAAFSPCEPVDYEVAQAPAHPEGLEADAEDPASRAAAALLHYVGRHQPFVLGQTSRLRRYALTDAMVLDEATRAHLELLQNSEDGTRARTLLDRIDETRTPLGARRLARWLAYPLVNAERIRARQDAVAFLADRDRLRGRVRDALAGVRDLERLLSKVARPGATPRDAVALRASLEALPALEAAVSDTAGEGDALLEGERPAALPVPRALPEVAGLLRSALADEVAPLPRGSRGALETGYIRDGYRAELDGLRGGVHKGRDWIAGHEAAERDRTGIANLKIRFHPVHGYSIEVTKTNLDRVPDDYERKQTLANAERFTTPALREIEQEVRGGTERAAALERELFEELRQTVLVASDEIGRAADAVAELDALASLAEVARRDGWTRPEVDETTQLEIHGGRHPVIEPLLVARGDEAFVPNDTELDPETRQIVVLTGPNMSGKSTYLRQVALIVLLAQLGSYVPAESARIGVVDRVFTRVGASDRLARGESTFMVEMRETAEILAHASPRSLLILDEIGRGTSTYDGLSIAWAVAEYLHDAPGVGARTLFATHYHELTDLPASHPRVVNAHFAAREWNDEVVFLRRLVEGGASRSYGIQVARLAGLPGRVLERAREILGQLESTGVENSGRARLAPEPKSADAQLGLFQEAAPDPKADAVLEELRALAVDETTPVEALTLLARWREQLSEEEPS